MDSIENSPTLKWAKKVCRKTWATNPIILMIWWLITAPFLGVFSIVMFVLTCCSIGKLSKHKEQAGEFQLIRAVLLISDVLICTALMLIYIFCGGEDTYFSLVIRPLLAILLPIVLFVINVIVYRKNIAAKGMFAALLITDPLLCYPILISLVWML